MLSELLTFRSHLDEQEREELDFGGLLVKLAQNDILRMQSVAIHCNLHQPSSADRYTDWATSTRFMSFKDTLDANPSGLQRHRDRYQ